MQPTAGVNNRGKWKPCGVDELPQVFGGVRLGGVGLVGAYVEVKEKAAQVDSICGCSSQCGVIETG
jgi:hypothetical protein